MSGWISSKLKVAETLLQQIDQQAAESLRKNEASRSADDLIHAAAIPNNIPPPLDHQLKIKKNKNSDFVRDDDVNQLNLKLHSEVNVNPDKSSSALTDGDWTELLSAPRVLKDARRPVRSGSGSNSLGLDRKRSQAVVNKSGNRTSAGVGVRDVAGKTDENVGTGSVSDGNCVKMRSDVVLGLKDEGGDGEIVGNISGGVEMSNKAEVMSASDGEVNVETDSGSSSDSESEREREERRKRREQVLAEKAAAKAIEAIKDRENLVARLEGEKQSLEKIIDERAKQQAHEASQLQMTMMETMEAADLEKQKHNNTRMEVLMKLAKLETTNAELAKSLAAAQWSLEVEVKRVAELHRQIELKEASHEELTSKKESRLSGNKLTASRGVEFEHEILEAEHAFVTDKVGQLQEKAKTLETAIQVARKEIENPSEVEVELKRRLSQLTDHLIQKQSQVETLSSEKAMLMFRIEAVSRSLDESKSCLKTSDVESGGRWEVRLEEKGQKHMIGSLVRQLDSIFSTFLLRRNPMGKIWSIVYLVCLHLWVLYIFRSHTDVASGSGAVISLDNINNTGV